MKRTKPGRGSPRTAAAIAALVLLGLTASGRAEQSQAIQHDASLTQQPGPVFVPGADPQFAEAFAEFETPMIPAPLEGAVDVTSIEPETTATRTLGSGVASYYADRFNGQRTANGERFSNAELTAAHRTLPFGSRVRVTNPRNGASVIVRINDRGPFTRGRTIDLSRAAAEQVGIVRAGHGTVELELIES